MGFACCCPKPAETSQVSVGHTVPCSVTLMIKAIYRALSGVQRMPIAKCTPSEALMLTIPSETAMHFTGKIGADALISRARRCGCNR